MKQAAARDRGILRAAKECECGEWVTSVARGATAFYDIDTPVTLAKLDAGDYEYITPAADPPLRCLSFIHRRSDARSIESRYGSPMARALYCSVDPEKYRPVEPRRRWDLGYLGTYSDDRQPTLDALAGATRAALERRTVRGSRAAVSRRASNGPRTSSAPSIFPPRAPGFLRRAAVHA